MINLKNTISENFYEDGINFRIKNSSMESGKNKVQIYIFDTSIKVARCAFVFDENEKKSFFSGIFVKPEFRQQGFANLLFEKFKNISEENNLDSSLTTKQEKPFVCYFLNKKGYSPLGKPVGSKFCIGKNTDNELGVYFENEYQRDRYFNSINSQLQPSLKPLNRSLCTTDLYVNTPYKIIS